MGKSFQIPSISLLIWGLFALENASAESWELRAVEGVGLGSEQIEAGQIDEAVRILATALDSNADSQKAAILANLCVAFALKLEYAAARRYCDQATSHPQACPIAFNNRGVVRAVTGDERGAIQDFQRATCLRSCRLAGLDERESVHAVARRNLGRVSQANLALRREVVRFQPRF